jgi:two-component system phosphate regulon sensor histidine kinase PhoR
MWWPTLSAFALVALVVVCLVWRRSRRKLTDALEGTRRSLAALRREHEELTNRKEAEQQALFNSMTEGVLVLDPAGRVQLVNQSLQRMFELPRAVRGQTVLEAFRLPQLAGLAQRLGHETVVQDFEIQLPGSTGRWIEVNAASVLDRDGVQLGTIMVFHDLTRIKQLENTRQEFVANVSHELRTPLSLIKGYVETLLESPRSDPSVISRFLRTIEKHADRLHYLIEDLLTISRLESGQVMMNVQPVALRSEVARVLDDLSSRAEEKRVALENHVPEGLSAQADAERLEQVFFNLIENAIKYGRERGRVTVGARAGDDGKVQLWVQDDGPGVPAESRDRVFERFYRVDRARSRESGGTGLGLAIVKHIVQAHRGEVWLQSELGQGSTFYFTLPGRGAGVPQTNASATAPVTAMAPPSSERQVGRSPSM